MTSKAKQFHERAIQILNAIASFDTQLINQEADAMTAKFRGYIEQEKFLSHQAIISKMARERMRSIYKKHLITMIKF